MLNVTVAAVNLVDCQMKTAQGVPTINAPCKPHHHATIPYKVVSIINPSVSPNTSLSTAFSFCPTVSRFQLWHWHVKFLGWRSCKNQTLKSTIELEQ